MLISCIVYRERCAAMMNSSQPVSRQISIQGIPPFANQTLIRCQVNATQIMWAMAESGGYSKADIKYKMLAEVYVVLTLCIFGFIGNTMTIVVLRKDPDRATSSTNWLLQTLALVDTICLASRSNRITFNIQMLNLVY